MVSKKLALMIAAPALAVGLMAAPAPAQAYWHRGGYYHGGGGGIIAGTILGLGAGALIGGALAPHYYAPPAYYAPPPVVYAPPPVVYAAPPPPVYYYPRY
jgi:hypothetical protein